jgi:uncharacterized repeat protein (TIGR03803 family)
VYKLAPSGDEAVLYTFTGGTDGSQPYAGVILDSAGNLYGTTYAGGAAGKGVVYKVTPAGQETVPHSFTGAPDGANPYAGVIADPAGNLYGTTYVGGITTGECFQYSGCGIVYQLDTAGQETVLHAFGGRSDFLSAPYAGVIRDSEGNLYGTANGFAPGGIYEVDAAGSYKVLYSFPIGSGPSEPEGGLIRDADGNLFGTSQYGGAANAGTVYELDTAGKLKELYAFPGGGLLQSIPQNSPNPGVVEDSAGNLYGVTAYAALAGTIYKVGSSGQQTTLYNFLGAAGGTDPASPIRDSAGNFYGAAGQGGRANAGVVYEVEPGGHETVLYSFTGGAYGASPSRALARDSSGNLYGTAFYVGIAVAYCNKAYSAMTDAKGSQMVKLMQFNVARLSVLSVNTAHTDEHYGNMVTYLRMKGIVPPSSERPAGQGQK